MNISRQNTDELNAVLKVDLGSADYMPNVDEAIKYYRKNVAIKGFRKGQVPPSLIRKMYGNSLLLDEINKLVSSGVDNYIKDEKIEILGRPMPVSTITELDINNPVDYSLEFEIGVAPEFSIKALDDKAAVTEYEIRIDDETVEKEMENLRQRYGISVTVEDGIQEGDIIYIKLEELDGDQVKEAGVSNITPVSTDLLKKDQKFYNSLLGKKTGESMDVDLFDIIDRDRDAVIKHILELKDGAPVGMGNRFRLTIDRVTRAQKAELTQEFFDRVFGPGKVTSEDEAKEKLRDELKSYFTRSAQDRLKHDIVELLISSSNIELPDDFLKRWIKASNDKPISEEQIEKEYPAFARSLRWSLISNKIGLENELKADFEEVKEFSREQLRQQMAMYNPGGEIGDDYLEMLNNSMLGKEEHVKKSYEGAMEQKLFTFIKSQLNTEKKSVSLDEFLER